MKPMVAFAALFAASVLVVPTVSQAASADTVRVSYADLNLRALDGRTALERRVAFAAQSVCSFGSNQELVLVAASGACEDQALARAKPQLDAAFAAARRGNVTVLDAAVLIVSAQ